MAALSVRVSEDNEAFVQKLVLKGISKTEAVNRALDLMRKAQLKKELTALALDEVDDNALLAEEGMDDYLNLLEDEI